MIIHSLQLGTPMSRGDIGALPIDVAQRMVRALLATSKEGIPLHPTVWMFWNEGAPIDGDGGEGDGGERYASWAAFRRDLQQPWAGGR